MILYEVYGLELSMSFFAMKHIFKGHFLMKSILKSHLYNVFL